MIFDAYMDAAGDPNSTVVYTMSCLVAPRTRWKDFSRVWDAAMQRGDAAGKILHMRELMPAKPSKGQFKGWEDDVHKIALLRKLFPIVQHLISFATCVTIPIGDYNRLIGGLGDPKFRLNEHNFCLQNAMQFVVESMKLRAGDAVYFVAEQDARIEADMMRQFYHLRTNIGGPDLFPEMKFAPKGPPPLQAADMVAYANHQFFADMLTTRPRGVREVCEFLSQSIRNLGDSHKCRFGFVSHKLLAEHQRTLLGLNADAIYVRDSIEEFEKADKQMQRTRNDAARALRKAQ